VFAYVLPTIQAAEVADRIAIRPRRPRLAFAVAIIAIITNAALSALCLWFIARLFR